MIVSNIARGLTFTAYFISPCCALWLFREHVLDVMSCSGPSMYPTLPIFHHRALILRLSPSSSKTSLRLGDIIIYRHPLFSDINGGKRVIGLPGDYVCAEEVYSESVGESGKMVRVPEGHVWVEGDNLPWSRDSRYYGPVPMGLVRGRFLGYWAKDKGGNGGWGWVKWNWVGRRGDGMVEDVKKVEVEHG